MTSRVIFTMVLLALGATAHAASGLIHSGTVEARSDYVEIQLQLSCGVHYLGSDSTAVGDVLRIRLEATTVCAGVSPAVADGHQMFRPTAADDAWLSSVEYEGESPGNQHLRLSFTKDVRFEVIQTNANNFSIQVFEEAVSAVANSERREPSRRVTQAAELDSRYVINLESSRRAPAASEMPRMTLEDKQQIFVSEASINGVVWYRTRLGYFETAELASRALRRVRANYPRAWIDRTTDRGDAITSTYAGKAGASDQSTAADVGPGAVDAVDALMRDAGRAMTGGELSLAVQIYTKVLLLPPHAKQPAAQEYLALARERNGQIAHAKAEYERFLANYPDDTAVPRVRQRLAALMTSAPRPDAVGVSRSTATAASRASGANDWKIRTFVSQHYRRDANQVNDLDEVVSQSSLFTNINLDVRRRGDRFDFGARFSGGHHYDLRDDETRTGDDLRVSYAYADLADSRTGLRGRLGRQTRNTGGVMGRFDGVNLSYALNERLQFDTVVGKPVFSTTDGAEDDRSFYGVSSTFGLFHKDLDFGVFYIAQEIAGQTDREAVGAEVRYFGQNHSFWGVADYDAEFAELGSAFVQGSVRLPADITITGLFDKRRSPFLNLGNAMIGQQLDSFSELLVLFTLDELRQLALDRAPESTTLTFGISKPLTPKMQLNLNANVSTIDATPESGGVAATAQSEYSYYSGDLVVSSLFTENDVVILGARFSSSDTTDVYSLNLDTRFRIGRAWRISPRLRVDYREINSDQSTQLILSPGLRLNYRRDRQLRFDLELGTQISTREMITEDQDRTSYYVSLGYQWHF